MNEETKRKIYEAYVNPNNRVEDIAREFKCCKRSVTHVAVEMGAEPRRPRRARGGAKHCPKCRRRIEVKGAKFCCYCGSDMRTEKELLIERIDRARECISLLPENARDEVQRLFVDIVTELTK